MADPSPSRLVRTGTSTRYAPVTWVHRNRQGIVPNTCCSLAVGRSFINCRPVWNCVRANVDETAELPAIRTESLRGRPDVRVADNTPGTTQFRYNLPIPRV